MPLPRLPSPQPPKPARRRWMAAAAGTSLWAALGGTGLLSGCGADRAPLSLAYHPWPGYAPLELARNMGWWEDRVRAVPTESASQSVEALRSGQAQAAALTLDEALLTHADGLPLAVVAIFNVSAGADVVLGHTSVTSGGIRPGLRVGHEAGMVGELMTASWLESLNVRSDQIVPVHLTPSRHEAAWRLREVDVLVTYEPMASRLVAQGAHRLFDSRALPAQRPIADVLVVRQDRLAAHVQALNTLVPLIFEGQRHVRELPTDTAHRLARWLVLPVEGVVDSFRGLRLTGWSDNREWLAGSAPLLPTVERNLGEFMFSHGLLKAPLRSAPASEAQFLPLEAPL